jgi:hypothetical protein
LIQVRALLTPMFVPCRHVIQFWRDVVRPMATDDRLLPILGYMEKVWIGKLRWSAPIEPHVIVIAAIYGS